MSPIASRNVIWLESQFHTLTFGFPDSMPDDKRAEFFAEMAEICRTSGLVEAVDHKPHISMPDDAYAPVFRTSAVAELRFQDKDRHQVFLAP